MSTPFVQNLGKRQRRRLIIVGLVRSFVVTVVLIGLYYVLPLDDMESVPVPVFLVGGLVIFAAFVGWEVREILEAKYPAIRAVEALAASVPLFLLLFATIYYLMGQNAVSSFTEPITRSDSLYFTVTTFSTTGFGDIAARSQTARLVVTVQMLLDLLVLGLGIRILVAAVRAGQRRSSSTAPVEDDATDDDGAGVISLAPSTDRSEDS